MIRNLALIQIFGLPLVVYGGISALLLFTLATYIGYTNKSGKGRIPFKWHERVVLLAFSVALVHAFFALSLFLNY